MMFSVSRSLERGDSLCGDDDFIEEDDGVDPSKEGQCSVSVGRTIDPALTPQLDVSADNVRVVVVSTDGVATDLLRQVVPSNLRIGSISWWQNPDGVSPAPFELTPQRRLHGEANLFLIGDAVVAPIGGALPGHHGYALADLLASKFPNASYVHVLAAFLTPPPSALATGLFCCRAFS
jgi:hypothetical protein